VNKLDSFSYDIVKDAFETFQIKENAYIFLTNYRGISSHYNLSPQKVKEVFLLMKCDLNAIINHLFQILRNQ
jgi:hypothetical protein